MVTLADKTTISWAEFVNALNDPTTVPAGTLPETAKEAIALKNAKTKTAEAKSTRSSAETTLNDAKAALTAPKAAYDSKESDLKSWNTQIGTINTNLETLNGTLSSLEQDKKVYDDELLTLNQDYTRNSQDLNNLEKTTNTTPYVLPWLKAINEAAQTFLSAYLADDNAPKVYYKKISDKKFGEIICLAFVQPADLTGWTEGSQLDLTTYYDGKTFDLLYVYMGPEYIAINGGNGFYDVTSFAGRNTTIIRLAVNAVSALADLPKYTSSKTETVYADPQRKTQIDAELLRLSGAIKKAQEESAKIQVKINGVNSQIKTANESKGALNDKIVAYTVTLGTDGITEQTRLKNAFDAALATVTEAETALAKAETAVAAAEAAEATAQAAADKAAQDLGLKSYKNVKLTGDVTVETVIESYDGIIDGQDHIINLGENVSSVFGALSGTINNVGVNGQLAANHVGAKMAKVAYWEKGAGTYYDVRGNVTENITNIGEYGFKVREFYGVDFVAKKLVNKTDATKIVYNISIYEPTSTTQKYVQNNNGTLYGTDNQPVQIPVNRFAKSETNDLKKVANVFYADNTCDNVVITDDKQSFYCPVELTAAKVSYNRTFVAGKNAVCLPFEMSVEGNDNIGYLATFDSETADKFFFTKKLGAIPAYTPVLLNAKNSFSFSNVENVVIKQTPASMYTVDEGNAEDPSKSFGILKNCTRDEFAGAQQSYRVYGLTTKGTFGRAAEDAKFLSLRMVVLSGMTNTTVTTRAGEEVSADEKEIVIVDEDKTTIVDEVASASLKVEGGRGEIVITSDTDRGTVDVYNMEGRLVTKAEVMAGSNNISVPGGVYIVMGKKVMVK